MSAHIARRLVFISIAVVLLAACGKGPVNSEMKQIATEVYVYAYPLVLMDVSKQVMTAKTPVNVLHHLREFPDAKFTEVVSPNADTLYSLAWMDLSKEPVVLSLPATGKRYYLMPMLDAWTNVFASPGSRTTGNGAGNYAIVGPHWEGKLPRGVQLIRSPTEMVWMIGRTQTNGKADYAAVNKLQDQYRLVPLSSWGTRAAKVEAAAPSASGDTKTAPADQVRAMSAGAFFTRFAGLLRGNPPSPDDGPVVQAMKRIGIEPGQPFDLKKLDEASANGVEEGAKAGLAAIVAAAKGGGGKENLKNSWNVELGLGRYGTDYAKRALIAWVGLGANTPDDAVYPLTRVDADGKALGGANRYVLHFEKKEIPPANAFWSLTMYNDKQLFVDNPINRYAIGDRDKLKFNRDGSLDIYIQNESPGKDNEDNWLPAPNDSFNLIMRLYWPRKAVLSGAWAPPPIKRVN